MSSLSSTPPENNWLNLYPVFWFGLDKFRVPTKAALLLPLLSWTGERGNTMKGSRVETRQGQITHQLLSRTNQTELGEKREFNSSPIKSE